jgi:hypothetical protein
VPSTPVPKPPQILAGISPGYFPDSKPKGFPGVHWHRGGFTASRGLVEQIRQVRRA